MIRLSDATLLAYTKLRARKVRLIVTVVISSLLFGLLALSSFVVRGVVRSTNSFAEEGFGKRYILSADNYGGDAYMLFEDPNVLNRALALQKDEIARKKVEAKRLGIEYDSNSERLVYYEGEGSKGKGRYLEPSHPLAVQAIQEALKQRHQIGMPELKNLGEKYGATSFYETQYLAFGDPKAGELKVLKEGKEEFKANQGNDNPFGGTGLDSFSGNWALMSGDLLKVFTLDGGNGLNTPEGLIPVVAPYSAVEQLLSLSPVPASAPSQTRLNRLQEVRSKAAKLEFSVCHRNSTSSGLVREAISQQADLEQNKKNKDYQKPSLIYDVPSEPCGSVRIVRDVRSAEEKALARKQETFRQLFGEEAPIQTTLHFVVVGVAPDPPSYAAAFVDSLISSVVTSNIGPGWYTPLEFKERVPILAGLFQENQINGRPTSRYVELPTPEQGRQMLNEANCQPDFTALSSPPSDLQTMSNPFTKCAQEGKPFVLMSYGSSSLALDELQKGFNKVFKIAAIVVIFIAGLIMTGTLGRIIADSRRETAVFRAIGAKRLDIAQVYITYTIAVSLLIIVVSIAVGFLLAQVVQSRFGARFTINALVAYNARDLSRQFYLYAWSSRDIAFIALSALSAGLISTIFPLIRNLRRNPIRDMRDEN